MKLEMHNILTVENSECLLPVLMGQVYKVLFSPFFSLIVIDILGLVETSVISRALRFLTTATTKTAATTKQQQQLSTLCNRESV